MTRLSLRNLVLKDMATATHIHGLLMAAVAFVAIETKTMVHMRVGTLSITALMDLFRDRLQRTVTG